MLLVGVCAMASDTSVKNADGVEIWYDFDSSAKTASVTYKGEASYSYYGEYIGNVVIPSKVKYEGEEYSVTSIGVETFYGCGSLTSITIPEGVTKIGEGAFLDCGSLTSITIPEGVTSIGESAFSYCSSLTSIDVALDNNSYTSINGVLFSKDKTILIKYPGGKKDATSYAIPEGVTSIGEYAFRDCSFLTSITIPESVTEIGEYAFDFCSSLTSITIPEGVTKIGEGAFIGCSSLTSITIPEGVTTIEMCAFSFCSSLTSIDVASNNNSYTSIDGVLFSKDKTILKEYPEGKKDVTSYAIPVSVTEIGDYAFSDCSSLTSITLPEGVTEIANVAFVNCSSLTSITIPEGVTEIGEWAFSGCSSLTSITIPEGVTEIGQSAFGFCSSLTSITIPKGVTEIGQSAFSGCSSLTSVTIPENVTEIGGGAFYNCSSLTSITIPENVTKIGKYAFDECSSLTSISSMNVTPPSIYGGYAFYKVDKSIPVYVPKQSVEAYKSAKYWEDFTNIQGIDDITPVSDVVADSVSIRLIGNSLIVEGAESYAVYALSGQCLGKVESLERGIYIVVANGNSYKVIAK